MNKKEKQKNTDYCQCSFVRNKIKKQKKYTIRHILERIHIKRASKIRVKVTIEE